MSDPEIGTSSPCLDEEEVLDNDQVTEASSEINAYTNLEMENDSEIREEITEETISQSVIVSQLLSLDVKGSVDPNISNKLKECDSEYLGTCSSSQNSDERTQNVEDNNAASHISTPCDLESTSGATEEDNFGQKISKSGQSEENVVNTEDEANSATDNVECLEQSDLTNTCSMVDDSFSTVRNESDTKKSDIINSSPTPSIIEISTIQTSQDNLSADRSAMINSSEIKNNVLDTCGDIIGTDPDCEKAVNDLKKEDCYDSNLANESDIADAPKIKGSICGDIKNTVEQQDEQQPFNIENINVQLNNEKTDTQSSPLNLHSNPPKTLTSETVLKSDSNLEADNSDELLSELESELNNDMPLPVHTDNLDISSENVTPIEETIVMDKYNSQKITTSTPNTSNSNQNSNDDSVVNNVNLIQSEQRNFDACNIVNNTNNSNTPTEPAVPLKVCEQVENLKTSGDSIDNVHEAKSVIPPNGMIQEKFNITDIPEFKDLGKKHERLKKFYNEKEMDVKRLSTQVSKLSDELLKTVKDRDVYISKIEHLEKNSAEQMYLKQISELKTNIEELNKQNEETKQRLSSHDAAAKKHIHELQNDMQIKMSKIAKAYEECKRDKEGMVVKYAMAEQKNLELQEKMTRNDRRVREMERERDNTVARYRQLKSEKEKSDGNMLARGQEIVNLRREIEKIKELRAETESKAKWANNKLKTELEAHKECKQRLEEMTRKHKHLKDESDQIRRECQSMIKEYQQTEGVKSITLSAKLDEKQMALQQQKQEKKDVEEVHFIVKNELDTLKRKHKEMIEELRTYKDKVTCLEAERIHQEELLSKFKNTLQLQKQDNRDLYEKLVQLEKVEIEFGNAKTDIENLKVEVEELTENNKDLRVDIDGCAKREGGHLEFSKRVSDKNAKLQSENSGLSNKLSNLQQEHDVLHTKCKELEELVKNIKEELKSESLQRIEENGSLRMKLEEKDRKVNELSQQVDDQKDENKTLKRRHQANMKDLTRQLQQAKRKLEVSDGVRSGNGERDSIGGSMGSRTSSTNSMNTVGQQNGEQGGRGSSQEPHHPHPQEEEQPIVQFVDVDKQILVEKIVKLQRIHARKNEKLEFMEDHINQLIEELQKKHRIIQSYALREETGTLAPEEMDLNKAQLAKKGGIMASVYNRHSQDDHLTLDLSLEINRKLQAVLEDTLLKNITLKDNMDTLGKEIANISQSNRELQLQIHKLKGKNS